MIEIFVKEAAQILFNFVENEIKTKSHSQETIEVDIQRALTEADNWSKHIQFFGMSQGHSTQERTIDLSYGIPRKFSNRKRTEYYSENDLLKIKRNLILLGDPGSGKTTTIKRLVQKIFTSVDDENISGGRFPIIVVLREYPNGESIHEMICTQLGLLKYCTIYDDFDPDSEFEKEKRVQIGKVPLREAVPIILENLRPIIFIDGLDEVDPATRRNLEVDVGRLARKLEKSKIIASCRSGDFLRNIDGFDVFEIRPLTEKQIASIAEKWLGDSKPFFSELAKIPNQDFLDRPLLLAQLIVIFRRAGYLPDQPASIYKRMLLLLLREWDEERNILRRSAYANFEREQKYDFLSAIAYHLTCVVKRKNFSHELLVDAYLAINVRFGLPSNQAKEVAREIETHTGIIIENNDSTFEFSHLTLQEYLCAEYLVREPFADLRRRYLEQYPGPLAIAVTLSANPSRWLAHLVDEVGGRAEWQSWSAFLARIIVERPRFAQSDVLGVAVLKICMVVKSNLKETVDHFLDLPHVSASFSDVLRCYVEEDTLEKDLVSLRLGPNAPIKIDGLALPTRGTISSSTYRSHKK